jgi:hypothetical protein
VQTRELALNLAACIVGEPGLAAAVVPLLKERDEYVRAQRDREPETVIIEAILTVIHENTKKRVQVTEITDLANSILRSRGGIIVYSPEEVGHRLNILGLKRMRTSAGMCLILSTATRQLVHELARKRDVPSASNIASPCV